MLIEQFLKRGCEHLTGQGTFGFSRSVDDSLVRIGGLAVPALIDVLNGRNWDMRVCAAAVLARIGPAARAAIPSLIRTIEHPDPRFNGEILSLYAVRALGRIGSDAKPAVPILIGLYGKNRVDDFDIVMALDGIGESPVRRLVETFLREGDPYAADQLAWLGPQAREAAPALRAALADKRPQSRYSAAVALVSIDPPSPESIPVLIEALNHLEDRDLELSNVPSTLARLGPRAKAALPTLIGLPIRGSDDTDVLKALVQIDPEGKECVPPLISALKQTDPDVVDVAASCLGLLGPRAKEAVPSLAEVVTRNFDGDGALSNSNPQVSAARALTRIGNPAISAIPALAMALTYRRMVREPGEVLDNVGERRDCSAAAAAADTLGAFGARSKTAVPFLRQAVKTRESDDDNEPARKAAILALGRIGPDAKSAIPVLRKMMKEVESRHYLPELLSALYQLDPEGKELAERWLDNPAVDRSGMAVERLLERRVIVFGAMGRANFEGDWMTRYWLGRLESAFANRDPRRADGTEYLEKWIETFGRFGPAGRLAVPRLNEFREHPNPWVRMWATEALSRIVPNDSRCRSLPAGPSRFQALLQQR